MLPLWRSLFHLQKWGGEAWAFIDWVVLEMEFLQTQSCFLHSIWIPPFILHLQRQRQLKLDYVNEVIKFSVQSQPQR